MGVVYEQELFGRMWYYTSYWNFKPFSAAIIWGSLGASHILWATLYAFAWRSSFMDIISWAVNTAIFGNLLYFFYLSMMDLENAEKRADYYDAALNSTFGPLIFWPFTLIVYISLVVWNLGSY